MRTILFDIGQLATCPPGSAQDEAGLIEDAKPIVTHVMETLAAEQDLEDPKVKSSIAAQVVPLINDLPNPVERDTYRQQLARFLKVDERSLIGGQAQGLRVKRIQRRPKKTSTKPMSRF